MAARGLIPLIAGLLCIQSVCEADVLYVNAASTAASPDGRSWRTAYKNIQSAVNAAAGGDEVWVAKGTYTATTDPVVTQKAGVNLYGGFAGTEDARDQRDWSVNPSIIDGQNARQGVKGASGATLDGFTVTRGLGRFGGGMQNGTAINCAFTANVADSGFGGGTYQSTATNCTFSRNTAFSAGGMYGGAATNCDFTENTASSGGGASEVAAVNCRFGQNSASNDGGGMYSGTAAKCDFLGNTAVFYGGGACTGTVTDSTFERNSAVQNGGGMYRGVAVNCLFAGNTTSGSNSTGGGIYVGTATNCTFSANTAVLNGGGMYGGTSTNCIFWRNGPDEVMGTAVTYSCLASNMNGVGNVVGDPRFVYPLSGGYRLRADSPCIDVGTASGAPTNDLLGRARPQGAGVDMGALEYYPGHGDGAVDPPVLRVNAASTAASPDGLTWETAYPTLQDAADHGGYGSEIWVAVGAYSVRTGAQVLSLNPGTTVYGGFAGTEIAREARRADNTLTVIDGEKTRRCVTASTTSLVDGFTLTNGKANNGGGMLGGRAANCILATNVANSSGGGISEGDAENCAFLKNAASTGGGMSGGAATNCTFTANSAVLDGGGAKDCAVLGCFFHANTATNGGGVFAGDAVNCVFTANNANAGGAMYLGTFVNCTLTGNSAKYGGGMYYGSATNCIFWQNTAPSAPEIGGTSTVTYSFVEGGHTGLGNMAGNPFFADAAKADLRLISTSPCIDAGTAAGAPATDIRGMARPQGAGYDMGAYEFTAGDPTPKTATYVVVPAGSGTVTGPPTVLTNTQLMLTVAASEGYLYASASATSGTIAGSAPNLNLTDVTGDTVVTVNFVPRTNAVAYAAIPVEGGTVTGPPTLETGASASLTALANAGYLYASASATSGAITGMPPDLTLSNVKADTTVTVGYVLGLKLNYVTSPEAGGTLAGPALIAPGATEGLTLMANAGYLYASMTATNGKVAGTPPAITLSEITEDATLTASFVPKTNAVFYVAIPREAGTVTGPPAILTADAAAFTVAPNAGYHIESVTASNGTITGMPSCMLSNVTENTTVTVTFAANENTITCLASPPVGGSISGPATVLTGGTATITATPYPGYTLSSVTASNGTITATAPYVLSGMTENTTVTATFTANSNAVTYTASPPTGGTITGPATLATGDSAALAVAPNPGYHVEAVNAIHGSVTATAPYILSGLTADTTVTATFAVDIHRVTYVASPSEGGSVTGPETLLTDDTAVITVVPNPQYALLLLFASDGSITQTVPHVLSGVTDDMTVTAIFTRQLVTVPDVAGQTRTAATAAFTDAGLVPGTVTQQYSATVPVGNVLSQDPAAGTKVAVGSQVNLTLSLGPEPAEGEGEGEGEPIQLVSVPDVSGMPADQAQTTLNAAGLAVLITAESSDGIPAGQVVRQEPAAGTQVMPGTQISLVVSSGPADTGCGCAGCFGGRGLVTPDGLRKTFGELFLGALGLMVLLGASRIKP